MSDNMLPKHIQKLLDTLGFKDEMELMNPDLVSRRLANFAEDQNKAESTKTFLITRANALRKDKELKLANETIQQQELTINQLTTELQAAKETPQVSPDLSLAEEYFEKLRISNEQRKEGEKARLELVSQRNEQKSRADRLEKSLEEAQTLTARLNNDLIKRDDEFRQLASSNQALRKAAQYQLPPPPTTNEATSQTMITMMKPRPMTHCINCRRSAADHHWKRCPMKPRPDFCQHCLIDGYTNETCPWKFDHRKYEVKYYAGRCYCGVGLELVNVNCANCKERHPEAFDRLTDEVDLSSIKFELQRVQGTKAKSASTSSQSNKH